MVCYRPRPGPGGDFFCPEANFGIAWMEKRVRIEPYNARQLDAVVRLSLRAWAPVFVHIERSMDPEVYRAFYPDGWEISQRAAVEGVCGDKETRVWVGIEGEDIAGFVAVRKHDATYAEIYMIAVDPSYQRRGFANALTEHALGWMRDQGVSIAMVETGSDPGHAPARGAYEKAGFGLFPVARYFKKL